MVDGTPAQNDNNDTLQWLILKQCLNNSRTINRLLKKYTTVSAILGAETSELRDCGCEQSELDNLRATYQKPQQTQAGRAALSNLAWLVKNEVQLLVPTIPPYPPMLEAQFKSPPMIFVSGSVEILTMPQLAIVGSRQATPTGCEIAGRFAHHLTEAGLCITSGLALGIDAAAHRAALDAGGLSIAVMGCGLDRIYPRNHRSLATAIKEQGALITEFAPGTPPLAPNFPRRNRLISALSLGVLVVEAATKSGALITARLAAEQGREVFAVPGSLKNPQTRGVHDLIRQGATLVYHPDQVLEELGHLLVGQRQMQQSKGVEKLLANSDVAPPSELSSLEQLVIKAIAHDPSTTDEIITRTDLDAGTVAQTLVQLEIKGIITHTNGRYEAIF